MSTLSSIGMPQSVLAPRDRLQNELLSEVQSGAVAAADQAALGSALDSIDQALSGAGAADRASGKAPPSPSEMQAKIAGLIADQVDAGTLTSDQADTLATIFDNAFSGGPGGPGGPGGGGGPGGPGGGGPGGAGGPPPGGPPPGSGSDESSDTSSDSTITDILAEFLAALQKATGTETGYDATGKTARSSTALVLDVES